MSSPDYTSDSPSEEPIYDNSNPRVCAYRTTRFYDQECSKYFDCPTHQIERARSDSSASEVEDEGGEVEEVENEEGEDEEGEGEGEDEGADEDEDEDEVHSSNEASSLSESRSASREMDEEALVASRSGPNSDPEGNIGADDARHDVIDLTTSPPDGDNASAQRLASGATDSMGATGAGSAQLGQERGRQDPEVIDLTNDSPEPLSRAAPSNSNQTAERALPNLPASASGSISSSQRSGGSGSLSAQRRPGTPPSPPPPVRRRTSTSNFGTARSNYQQQRAVESSGSSDIVLPRWQPDAEVTICPICHTQFSIFVRKHHCRYV